MATVPAVAYTYRMQVLGRVSNGVVILEGNRSLPEGTQVVVTVCPTDCETMGSPLPFPVVRSEQPSSLDLTNEKIAELLEDEDFSSGR
jgi:hypothetical protein